MIVPRARLSTPSMKVPPKRKGNLDDTLPDLDISAPSMKVPPKRKGNSIDIRQHFTIVGLPLNESPSEKEGKS